MNNKCIPADLPETLIQRPKLMKIIKEIAIHRYIFIRAPAGSGKTVTALLWNSICKRIPLWISLDNYDNVPSVFYKLFSSVLCSTQPNNKNMLSILEDQSFSASPVEHTIKLIMEMQANKNLYTLTLDDLHLINNIDILNSLPAVLKRLPQSFLVLFLSRNEAPESFHNKKTGILKQKDNIINIESLQFSEKELNTYFLKLGRTLTKEEAAIVLKITEGLIIGINAIAKSGNIENGNTEYTFANYVREHLWENWDKDLRKFMLKTSIVDEINEKLAITLTGCKATNEILKKLCAENIFISHVGKDIYRYHHLFLAFLRDMAVKSKINLAALYKTAADYYLDEKKYLIARHYAIQSGNDKTILKVIHEFNQFKNHVDDPSTLEEFEFVTNMLNSDILSKGICDRYPYLYTTVMEGAWISGDVQTVEKTWDKLQHYFPVIALKYPKMLETVLLELAMDHRKTINDLIDGISKSIPAILHIILHNKTFQLSTVTLQLPFVHRCVRDLSEFTCEDLMKKFDKIILPFFHELGNTIQICIMSGILLEKNRVKEALVLAKQGKEELNIKNPEVVFCVYNHLSAIYFAMGNEVLLKETLAETELFIKRSGAHFLDRNFFAWKTKIQLANADKKAAGEWLDNYFINNEGHVPLYKIFQYFTTVRAYIVLNQVKRAMALIERIIQFARDYRRPMDLAEALTLKACLKWVTAQRAESVIILEEALFEMQEKKLIRVIADEGAAIVPILKRINSSIGLNENSILNRNYLVEVTLAASETANRYRGITANFKKSGRLVKLSKQQKTMLELRAKGYKNLEVANITKLSTPTVKWHLMRVYEKLEVNNITDALMKAKKMGLM